MNKQAYLDGYMIKSGKATSNQEIGDTIVAEIGKMRNTPQWRYSNYLPAIGGATGATLGGLVALAVSRKMIRTQKLRALKRVLLGGAAGGGLGWGVGTHLRYKARAPMVHDLIRNAFSTLVKQAPPPSNQTMEDVIKEQQENPYRDYQEIPGEEAGV